MASNDDSQNSGPGILSLDKAALKRKRAAMFDELSRLSPKAIVNGINRNEHGDKRAEKSGRADSPN